MQHCQVSCNVHTRRLYLDFGMRRENVAIELPNLIFPTKQSAG